MSKLPCTTPGPPNLVSSIKLYREKWWKCDRRRRRQYLHKVSWPPARGSLLHIQIVGRKWGKISEEIPELLDIDSWRHSHKTLNTSTCLLSTVYCFLHLPPALEPQLIWLFMWSSKRHFSAVNQKPAAVSRMFSAWIKDPVLWAGEAVHRQTQIGKFAGNLGQNMWLILILLSSKTGEIDCPAAGPRDTAGARLSPAVIRCRPVRDVWYFIFTLASQKLGFLGCMCKSCLQWQKQREIFLTKRVSVQIWKVEALSNMAYMSGQKSAGDGAPSNVFLHPWLTVEWINFCTGSHRHMWPNIICL